MSQSGRVLYRLESGPRQRAISHVEYRGTAGNRLQDRGEVHLRHHGARWNDEVKAAQFNILPRLSQQRPIIPKRFDRRTQVYPDIPARAQVGHVLPARAHSQFGAQIIARLHYDDFCCAFGERMCVKVIAAYLRRRKIPATAVSCFITRLSRLLTCER